MRILRTQLKAAGFALAVCTLFTSCMNRPAESITTDSSNNEGLFDTTAAQVAVAPAEDSLSIAVRDVIAKYPGVKANVENGEILLTGEIVGKKLQYLITDLNTLRPKNIVNKMTVKK